MKKLFLVLVLAFLLIPKDATATTERSMGECKITYYCPCSECSGRWGRKTATQTTATAGRTVAVDPDVIAYGTILEIGGKTYIAEDCGKHVVGDHIDIFVDTHEEVKELGKTKELVLIVGRKKLKK